MAPPSSRRCYARSQPPTRLRARVTRARNVGHLRRLLLVGGQRRVAVRPEAGRVALASEAGGGVVLLEGAAGEGLGLLRGALADGLVERRLAEGLGRVPGGAPHELAGDVLLLVVVGHGLGVVVLLDLLGEHDVVTLHEGVLPVEGPAVGG